MPVLGDGPDVVIVSEVESITRPARPNPRPRRKIEPAAAPALMELYGGFESLLVRTALIRSPEYDAKKIPTITTPLEAARLLRHLAALDQEHLVTMALDAQNRVTAIHEAAIGGTASVGQIPRHLLKVAMMTGASELIVAHNHPSGNPLPSADDIFFVAHLMRGAHCADLDVLDALIIAAEGWTSLKELTEDVGAWNGVQTPSTHKGIDSSR